MSDQPPPPASRGNEPGPDTGSDWLGNSGDAGDATRREPPVPGGDAPARDPVEAALARLEGSEPESIEATVVRAALEIPGVAGSILFELSPTGGLEPVAVAGDQPPTEASATEDSPAAPEGPPLLSATIPRWGTSPTYRLVLSIGPGSPPETLLDDIERYARLAAPYLAAGAITRRAEAAGRRLDQTDRDLSLARRTSRAALFEALLGRIASRICAALADPLGSVLGCARTLSETDDEKTRAALVEDLLGASSRGCRIVEHLATLCAMEASADWGPFEPRQALLEAAGECDGELRTTGSGVDIRVEGELPRIEGNQDLLRLSVACALRALSGDQPSGSPGKIAFEARSAEGGLRVLAQASDAPGASDPRGSEVARLGRWIAEEIWKEFGASFENPGGDAARGFSVQFPAYPRG